MTKKSHKTYAESHYKDEKRKRELASYIKRHARIARYRATITKYQIDAIEILETRGIQVEIEKAIQYKATFFLIDIFLPKYNMCIEIDWDYHNDTEVIKTDKIRDDYLKSEWYWVLRVKNKQVRSWFYQMVKNAICTRNKIIQNTEKNKILA